jgi:hypothetical protein
MKMSDESYGSELEIVRVPLYLGISLHDDPKMNVKMCEMIPNAVRKLMEHGHNGQMI